MMTESVKRLKELVDGSDNIVFFGGAGVSTESGIPDFRSTDGLYHQQWRYPPEVILSHTFYESNPEEFFRFYRAKLLSPGAKPNAAHRKLAQWEAAGKLRAIVTQNIDGLHQAAGSREVLELHGSVHRNHCQNCHAFYGVEAVKNSEGVPRCPVCGAPMTMNLRCDGTFVEDDGWHEAAGRYEKFVQSHAGTHILYLELGVGANTPAIIKYPFWRMTYQNPKAVYACVNYGEAYAPKEIMDRSICIDGDIGNLLKQLK